MGSVDFDLLYSSKDYRDFLRMYLNLKKLNSADFARMVGCHRSFPADVINGRRRLTAKSFYLFERALKLTALQKSFFQLLLAKEETDIFPQINPDIIQLKISSIKAQQSSIKSNHRKNKFIQTNDPTNSILDNSFSFLIYAAAGAPETGATLNDIQKRTRLTNAQLDKTLKLLVDNNLLKFEFDRYFPQELHIFFQLNNTSETLKKLFTIGARSAEKRLSQITPNSDEMFFVSQFCIQENQMPQFKKQLKDLVLKFVDESMSNDGDRVVRLLAALHF